MVNEGTENGINLKIRNELGVTLSNSFKDEKEKRNYKWPQKAFLMKMFQGSALIQKNGEECRL